MITKTKSLVLTALLAVGMVLATALPAQAAGSTVTYLSSTTGGSSGVLVVSGGTTTLYPGHSRTSVTNIKARPGQVVYWRYVGSTAPHTLANHSTTETLYMTVTAATYITGSTYY